MDGVDDDDAAAEPGFFIRVLCLRVGESVPCSRETRSIESCPVPSINHHQQTQLKCCPLIEAGGYQSIEQLTRVHQEDKLRVFYVLAELEMHSYTVHISILNRGLREIGMGIGGLFDEVLMASPDSSIILW